MATKRFKNGKFRYTVKNKKLLPKPIYLSFANENDGDAYVAELEELLNKGIVPVEFREESSGSIKLHELIKSYIKDVSMTDDNRMFMQLHCARLDNIDVGQITYQWCVDWVKDMKHNRKLVPSTITKHVGSLARCIDWAVNYKYVTANPLRSLPKGYAQYNSEDASKAGVYKLNTERDRRLEAGEEEKILEVLTGHRQAKNKQRGLELDNTSAYQTFFLLALETAMRMREMYTLDMSQVDLAKRTIFLKKTKNGSTRQVPLSNPALALLKQYIKENKPDLYLFPWFSGNYSESNLKKTTAKLSGQWSRIFEHAGCEDLTFHDLRHEATSRIYERTTLSDMEISKITGHKTLRMLQRYANLRGSDLAGKLW